jgi:hypothetical protein
MAMVAGTASCDDNLQAGDMPSPSGLPGGEETDSANSETADEEPIAADVLAVRAGGTPGAYTLSVTLSSPDTGCDQYANWWEVLTPEGTLVYRRILTHSHVDEQPFTRSGGPVDVDDTTEVVVRAHMNNGGYGGVAFAGSIASEFAADPSVNAALAPELADALPQPTGCAF